MRVLVWRGVQTSVPLRNVILFTKSCVHLRKFIVFSAVAALAVSLLRRQNGDGSEKERARSLAQKWKTESVREVRIKNDEYERAAVPSIANKARGRPQKLPYPHVLCDIPHILETLSM